MNVECHLCFGIVRPGVVIGLGRDGLGRHESTPTTTPFFTLHFYVLAFFSPGMFHN